MCVYGIMSADIRLRSERRLGELLLEMKAAGTLKAGQPKKNSQGESRILQAAGGAQQGRRDRDGWIPGVAFNTVEGWSRDVSEEIAYDVCSTGLTTLTKR
jgi:hypothetical protein